MDQKTSLGLAANVEALLSVLFAWLGGIIFLLLEKENKFVRFYALQSIATFIPLNIIAWIFNFLAGFLGIFGIVAWAVGVVNFVVWVVLMVKAFKGEVFKLPIVGDIVEQQINKMQ